MSDTMNQQERELDLLIADLEQENRLIQARNERLQKIVDGIVPRLEAACGARTMPAMVAHDFIESMKS